MGKVLRRNGEEVTFLGNMGHKGHVRYSPRPGSINLFGDHEGSFQMLLDTNSRYTNRSFRFAKKYAFPVVEISHSTRVPLYEPVYLFLANTYKRYQDFKE